MQNFWLIGETKGDLYIGKGAGKHLLESIQNAKESIYVFSPYLSADLLKNLLQKRTQGLDVACVGQVISHVGGNQNENRYGLRPFISEIVEQKKEVLQDNVEQRAQLKQRAQKILAWGKAIVAFCVIIVCLIGFLIAMNTDFAQAPVNSFLIFIAFIFVPIFLYTLCYFPILKYAKSLEKQAYQLPVNKYSYIPTSARFRLLRKAENHADNPFYHLKMVIVDKKIAFLGSFNFTTSGTQFNIESSLKIKDKDTIDKLTKCYNELFVDVTAGSYTISELVDYYYTKTENVYDLPLKNAPYTYPEKLSYKPRNYPY